MSLIKTNHQAASENSFAVLPVGKYETFIEGGQVKTTKSGSPMINFKLKIRSDVQQQGGGRNLFTNLVIQENTMGMVQGFLKAIGSPDGAEYETAADLVAFATGRSVKAHVKIGQWNGEDRNEVGYFLPSDLADHKPNTTVPSGHVPAINEDPFATGAQQPPVEVSEDDLPF